MTVLSLNGWPGREALANGGSGVGHDHEELVARFWLHAEQFYRQPDGSPSGEADNYRQVLGPLKALYANTPAAKFGPRALASVRQRMIEVKWSRTFINRQIGRIRRVFRWAVSQEYLPAAVHHALLSLPGLREGKSEARETEPVKPVLEEHVEAIGPVFLPTGEGDDEIAAHHRDALRRDMHHPGLRHRNRRRAGRHE
jgi:hypothetical protein